MKLLALVVGIGSVHLFNLSCKTNNDSGALAVETAGERASCEISTQSYLENIKTFKEHLETINGCMGILGDHLQADSTLTRKGDQSDQIRQRSHCINDVISKIEAVTPLAYQRGVGITELQAQFIKCLGAKGEDEQALVFWLIENNKLLSTERWMTKNFLYPILPVTGRGAQVYSTILLPESDPKYDLSLQRYTTCLRSSDPALMQFLRLKDYAKDWDDEGCADPTKSKDRNIKSIAFWMCDSPCQYSGANCVRCSVPGSRGLTQTCSTEIGARHSLQNWCKDTFSKDCPEVKCNVTNEDDVIIGRDVSGGEGNSSEGAIQTLGSNCESHSEGQEHELVGKIGGSFKASFVGNFKTPLGGASATAGRTSTYLKKGILNAKVTSSFTICSEGFEPWLKRKDGSIEADHTAHFSCTANFDSVEIESDELEHSIEARLEIATPVMSSEAVGVAGVNKLAKSFENMTVAWTSGLKSAGGAAPAVLEATCQRAVANWLGNTFQSWIDRHPTAWNARAIGSVHKGFCTDDSDCKSTRFNSTNRFLGKIYRCAKQKSGTGKCVLRSTGRVTRQNRFCGNRCNLRWYQSGIEACDTKGGFSCEMTEVPYTGWHWAWQDPKKLQETVYQCVNKAWREKNRYASRRVCVNLPGISGD